MTTHAQDCLQRAATRDERVPLSDADRAMEHSWRMIPVPPEATGDWFIATAAATAKTTWGRWRASTAAEAVHKIDRSTPPRKEDDTQSQITGVK